MVVIKSRKKKIYILKLILIQIVDGFCHLLLSRDVTEGNRKWNCATTLKRICDSDRILLCWSLFSASCSIKLLWTSNKNNKCLTSHTRILVSIKRACTLGCRHSDCRHCTSFNNKTNINCMLVRWQSIRKFLLLCCSFLSGLVYIKYDAVREAPVLACTPHFSRTRKFLCLSRAGSEH